MDRAIAVARPGLHLRIPGVLASLAIVLGIALLANWLSRVSPRALEYPLWAAGLGLAANLMLGAGGLRDRVSQAFRTELFLKTGLVLMGASVNLREILSIGARGVLQAVLVVSCIFLFTWYVARAVGIDDKLRAVMCAAVAVCGVSAAIAAAGAVLAKKEHLAYVTALVIAFALPMMVLQPYLAGALGLGEDVAGAWIGGNIDTTAAVVGAGALYSERAMKVASIVKLSQNALIGVVAFLLALYWVAVVERKPNERPRVREIWDRFPKFILGFVAVSLIATVGLLNPTQVKTLTNLRNWFLTLAFVCIGLELAFAEFRKASWRPIAVYLLATAFNTVFALGVAWMLFA